MESVQDRIQSSLLVPIWLALPYLPTGGLIGRRRGNPGCGSLLGKFGTSCLKIMLRRLSVLVHIHDFLPLENALKDKGNSMVITASVHSLVEWRRMVWLHRFNLLILQSSNCILVVISHPKVAYLLPTGLDWLLEQGIHEPSIVRPVGEDPGPVGGWQAIAIFLGPKGFLSWPPPLIMWAYQ